MLNYDKLSRSNEEANSLSKEDVIEIEGLRFAVRDTQQLDQLLSLIKKFGDSRTSIELKTLFDSKEIPLP